MKLDTSYEFAALTGHEVCIEHGAETHVATVMRPVLLWELRGDDGTLHLLAPDGTWTVTPSHLAEIELREHFAKLDETKAAEKRRRAARA